MALYERTSGDHVAERVRPVPGSDEETRLERLAADRTDGWRRVDDEPVKPKTARKRPDPAS
ncbi:hypothetical protein [Microbispora rosea]